MENLPVSEHRNELLEAFKSIRHASGDLLQTMNDLLLLESMDSAAFSIEEEMTPCAHLTQIAENCGLMPREKEIIFAVNNQCDSNASLTYVEHIAEEYVEEDDEERVTDLELGLASSGGHADSELLLFIDEHKIGQVLRNLITNSSKFTPAGKSIVVNIRPATSLDLTGNHDGNEVDPARRTRALEFAREKGYIPFFFTLPSFKKKAFSDEEGAAPVGISAQSTSSYSVTSRGARISPEATSSTCVVAASDTTAADKFSKLVSRPLGRAGVCKVLVVDDSSFNVKVMKNILKKVSATWRCPSPMPTTAEGEEESRGGVIAGGNRSNDSTVNVALDVSEADDGAAAVRLVLAASEAGSPFDIVFMDNIMILMYPVTFLFLQAVVAYCRAGMKLALQGGFPSSTSQILANGCGIPILESANRH
eukprot:gene24140-31378_t